MVLELDHLSFHLRSVDAADEAVVLLIIVLLGQISSHVGKRVNDDAGNDGRQDQNYDEIVQVVKGEPAHGRTGTFGNGIITTRQLSGFHHVSSAVDQTGPERNP